MNASVIDALIIAGICASVGWAWRIDKRIDRIDLTLKRLMRDLGLVMVLCLGVGCGHLGNPVVQQPVVTQQPVTNAVGQIELIQVTNVVHLVNTNWLNALEASAAVNAATNPTPSAPFINLALGSLAAGLGWYARIKTRRAAGAQALSAARNRRPRKLLKRKPRVAASFLNSITWSKTYEQSHQSPHLHRPLQDR
jgi:hypothetical protein